MSTLPYLPDTIGKALFDDPVTQMNTNQPIDDASDRYLDGVYDHDPVAWSANMARAWGSLLQYLIGRVKSTQRFINVEALSADLGLNLDSAAVQVLDPDGADRNVVLAMVPAAFMVQNGGTANALVVAAGSLSARFKSPSRVAFDSDGNAYVADTSNHTIRKITPEGLVTTLAGEAGVSGTSDGTGVTAHFNLPMGLALDDDDNIYVADAGNHAIRMVTPAGVVTTLAGLCGTSGYADDTGAAARFNGPAGICVDGDGNLFVADTGNQTIRQIVITSAVVTTIAGTHGTAGSDDGTGTAALFAYPEDIILASDGNLYIADTQNSTIRKLVIATAVVTTLAGSAGNNGSTDGVGSAARFYNPYGIGADADGNLFVADLNNHTIRRIVIATTTVSTLAGLAGSSGTTDGLGGVARFNSPRGVVVDAAGTLVVSDTANHSLRFILPPAVVTTVAGKSGTFGTTDSTTLATVGTGGTVLVVGDGASWRVLLETQAPYANDEVITDPGDGEDIPVDKGGSCLLTDPGGATTSRNLGDPTFAGQRLLFSGVHNNSGYSVVITVANHLLGGPYTIITTPGDSPAYGIQLQAVNVGADGLRWAVVFNAGTTLSSPS